MIFELKTIGEILFLFAHERRAFQDTAKGRAFNSHGIIVATINRLTHEELGIALGPPSHC